MASSVTIRMYNQKNLGDCFLLKCRSGSETTYILIDFGSYTGNKERELEIAQNIIDTVKDTPIILVLSHQHKDHLSGYISAAELLKDLNVKEVWFSYLDSPTGKEAIAMREATEKFWNETKKAKTKVKARFGANAKVDKMLKAMDAIDLFAEEQKGGEAVSNLIGWCPGKPKFLLPGKWFTVPGLDEDTIRVYVLGPPTDDELLKSLNPREDEAVHKLDTMMGIEASSKMMMDALVENGQLTRREQFPFTAKYRCPAVALTPGSESFSQNAAIDPTKNIIKRYTEQEWDWRRIDHDWLSELGRLSLHMGDLTNNSSLVLAFELVKEDKVLLFVADAQIGNWKSWFDVKFKGSEVTAEDLLQRTVFYKAGHHSSHNATLAESLDLMNEDELVIMIPVNGEVSKKMGFLMLKPGMLKGYNRKAKGRVLRSDTIFHETTATKSFKYEFVNKLSDFKPAVKKKMDAENKTHLYIEYTV